MRTDIRKKKITVGVVGAGASGMAAAIAAAREGAKVTLLEGGERVGKKILSTGNGKCNLGNLALDAEQYYGSRAFVAKALERFGVQDTIDFFQGMGLMIKSKNGYLYPACEQASAVLDVLRWELKSLDVEILTECKVTGIFREEKSGTVAVKTAEKRLSFDRVILACGGCAAPKTGSDGSGFDLAAKLGHSLIPRVPALVQLRCEEEWFKALAGVRAEAGISLYEGKTCVASERGELQLTDYGISGIPVFQISRVANYILREKSWVRVQIDFLPDLEGETFENFCNTRMLLQGSRTVEEFFTGMLHKKIMALFIKLAGLKPGQMVKDVPAESLRKVFALCKNWTVHVTGSNSFDQAQVSAGGVNTAEITDQMESRKMPGVYLVGELLDVDGRCGGYNLQWAWTSGYLAGTAAGQVEERRQ